MEFCCIYGRSGTGKTKYIFDDIKKEINSKKIYLVVPEQSNLSAEQKLFEELNVESLMNIEVLTLSRMANRVLNEVGEKSRKTLSVSSKNMIIYDILLKEKDKLKFLGKSEKNIEIVSNLITELKKHEITSEKLINCDIDEQYTKLKIEDVKNIYEKYQEKIRNSFVDETDEFTLLCENIDKVDFFKDSVIYFDDFLGFTTQEYKIFEKLLVQAKKIVVTVPTDSLFITKKEDDIFYFNKIFGNKLIEIASKKNVQIKTIELNRNCRHKSEDLLYLEDSFSKNLLKKYNGNVENIKLLISDNPYKEIENIAKIIFSLVKKENYKYKDFFIISGSVEEYRDDVKNIFSKYDIPVFIDEKKELNQNILVKYIISMLDIFSKNWSFESVLNYMKSGLLNLSPMQICEFENYCLKWGIKNKKWFNKLEYEVENDKQIEFEKIRESIINPLLEFKDKVSENRKCSEITKTIYEFLIENEINVILDNKIKKINKQEITNEYNTSYKILINLLDEINYIFGEEIMSFSKYKELLQVGLNSSEFGKIPATQDGVIFGDISRSRSSDIKIEFLIGVNDGKIPSSNKVEGFLNDEDRSILLKGGLELAKDSKDNMYEEQFNIYRMITLPEEKLYISYSLADKAGISIRPSILIKKIKKIFDIEEQAFSEYNITNYKATFESALNLYQDAVYNQLDIEETWKNVIGYYYSKDRDAFESAISGLEYNNKSEVISEKNIKELYGDTLKTSISRLEKYQSCPFSFHLTYGLKLNEKKVLKMENVDTGNFMHEVIESFFKKLEDKNINVKTIDNSEIEKIVVKIINELFETSRYYIFSSTAKFKILSRRLKKVVLKSIEYIVYTLKNSKFDVLGNEIEFSRNSEYKPIVVELDSGEKVEITGKIDRVDVGKLNDKQYVRIIDYKSSFKSLDFNKVIAGLQIQLITYLDDICEQLDFTPSGVLYMNLIDNIAKSSRNLSDEEIADKIRKNFKMQGVILANTEVVKMMDTNLKSGYSDIIPVGIKNDGEIMESKSSVLKKEDFYNLQKSVKKIIKQISKEILNGNIDIKPYYYQKKNGCEYCKYKTICSFNTSIEGNEYNYIRKYNKQQILEKIRNQN